MNRSEDYASEAYEYSKRAFEHADQCFNEVSDNGRTGHLANALVFGLLALGSMVQQAMAANIETDKNVK